MKTIQKLSFMAVITLLLCTACETNIESQGVTKWGAIEYFDPFWGNVQELQVMNKTIRFNFNDDAKALVKDTIRFEVVAKDITGTFVPAEYIQVYKNGILCNDNMLCITVEDKDVILGIALMPKAGEGDHKLYLIKRADGGLDNISNQLELSGFTVTKHVVTNPLKLGVVWGLILFGAIILSWIIIAHLFVNPHVSFSKVRIDYPNDISTVLDTGGVYQVLCTNKRVRISLFRKIFVGNTKVEVNDFWEQPLIITNGYGKKLKFRGSYYYVNPDPAYRGDEIMISKENDNTKVIIQTN